MIKSPIRVLIVDDYEPWRRHFSTRLRSEQGLQVINEVSDGLVAVQQAQELQPDLILLDIGLPSLNGIEAARRIRKVSPASKILFVSENRSAEIAAEALSTGAGGYVLKSDAGEELLPAVEAVLGGKRFVSVNVANRLKGPLDPQTGARYHHDKIATLIATPTAGSTRHHEVELYSNDREFLGHVTRFLGEALKAGNAAIVVATESHRESLCSELQAYGIDTGAAIEQGRYIQLDAGDTLSMLMVNGMPDPVRFLELFGDLIVAAREAVSGANPRVSAFGECAPLLWEQGKAEAAIQIEKLANKLTEIHGVAILCGYPVVGIDNDKFQRICAEHSAVYSQ